MHVAYCVARFVRTATAPDRCVWSQDRGPRTRLRLPVHTSAPHVSRTRTNRTSDGIEPNPARTNGTRTQKYKKNMCKHPNRTEPLSSKNRNRTRTHNFDFLPISKQNCRAVSAKYRTRRTARSFYPACSCGDYVYDSNSILRPLDGLRRPSDCVWTVVKVTVLTSRSSHQSSWRQTVWATDIGRQTNRATANWATHFGQLGDRSRNNWTTHNSGSVYD